MNTEPIKFGDGFELDPRSYQLRRSGRAVKLERIPVELLLLLLERQGEVVTRDQIIERVWGKDVFLDTDNSINAAIRKIRQVLKDDPAQPQFVQTVTGRGYRFIAPSRQDTGSASVPRSRPRPVEPARGMSPALTLRVVLPVVIALMVAVGVYFQWVRTRPHAAAGRLMLAVLPFENLTGDSGQDYFSDGLTEEMISRLGNLDPQHLGVIARTSVMHYKDGKEELSKIGSDLGVEYVLEGSVRRGGDKVRITAQLIQMQDQTHVWARQYDRDLKDLLAVQGEIAQQVAGEIQRALGDRQSTGPALPVPLDPKAYEAYDLYLRGRYFWNKRTTQGFEQAIEYFQKSIAQDPTYAPAYAGLADSYALLSGYNLTLQSESMPKARAAALKALELDDGLAEAHTSLALVTENYDWDWQKAEKEYRRAIELNPNYATAHQWYAEYLSLQGRFDEAIAESERARQLDPLSLIIASDNGTILFYARRYDSAIAQFRVVQEMEPSDSHTITSAAAYIEKGEFPGAVAELERWGHGSSGPWLWSWRAFVYSRTGQPVKARQALEELQRIYTQQRLAPDPMIWAYIGMRDKDQAFAWFEKGYADHSNALTSLKVNPAYDPLRGDPRYQDLMRRVRLAP